MILLHSVHFHIYALFALACVRVPVRFAFECFTRSHISGVLVVIEACRRLGNHPRTAHIYTHQSRCCALISGLRLSRTADHLSDLSVRLQLRAHRYSTSSAHIHEPVCLLSVGCFFSNRPQCCSPSVFVKLGFIIKLDLVMRGMAL